MVNARLVPILMSLFAAPLSGQGNILVVDDNGGPGDLPTLNEAIVTAEAGDMVLVKHGIYDTIDDFWLSTITKGVGIFAKRGTTPVVKPVEVYVSGIPADEQLIIRGLEFQQSTGIFIGDCEGLVWIEDCTFDFGSFSVLNSDQVVLVGCSGTGTTTGETGLSVQNSRVAAYDCEFEGGSVAHPSGGFGGHGVVVNDSSFLFASGCRFEGGRSFLSGFGLWVGPEGNSGQVLDCAIVSGSTGSVSIHDPNGVVEFFEGEARSLVVDGPVVYGTNTLALEFQGTPGDVVLLPRSVEAGFGPFRKFRGVFAIDLSSFLNSRVGVIPATGTMSVPPINVPDFPELSFLPYVMQPVHFDAGGEKYLGRPSAIWMYAGQ